MRLEIELIDPEQDRTADDQRKAHDPGIEQMRLDESAGKGSDYRCGQERHQQTDDESPVLGIGKHAKRYPPQFGEVDHDDREDRTELDQYVEALPEIVLIETEKSCHQQQMARRRHRKEFRDTLDDAENHGLQRI